MDFPFLDLTLWDLVLGWTWPWDSDLGLSKLEKNYLRPSHCYNITKELNNALFTVCISVYAHTRNNRQSSARVRTTFFYRLFLMMNG